MKQDAAVSPVIGSILMIVLTLIVAGIASSLAGGLVETKGKPPFVTLEAEYSLSGDLSLIHIAGDPVPLSQISLRLTPSKTFGIDAIKHSRALDKTKFQNIDGDKWGNITIMQVGDRHFIPYAERSVLDAGETNPAYQVLSSDVGQTFYLEVYYENNLIAKPEVLIRS